MTFEEIKKRNYGARIIQSPIDALPACPEYEPQPRPIDKIAHQEQGRPAKPEDYNGMSLEDVQTLNELRHSDREHAVDALESELKRSKQGRKVLAEDLKIHGKPEETARRFANLYKKK